MRSAVVVALQVVCIVTVLYSIRQQSDQVQALAVSVQRLGEEQAADATALADRLDLLGRPAPVVAEQASASDPTIAALLDRLTTLEQRIAATVQPAARNPGARAHGFEAAHDVGAAEPESGWLLEQARTLVDDAIAQGSWSETSRDALRRFAVRLPAAQFDVLMRRLHDAMNTGEIDPGDIELM